MPDFTLSIESHTSLTGRLELPVSRPPLWRVLHEREVPSAWRNVPPRMPEVRPLFPNHHVPFGKYWQLLSWKMNPLLTAGNMTAVYHFRLWIANNQGFGMEDDPRANYFENKNLSRALPRVEALTCGGNLLTGQIQGDNLLLETLDWRNAPPSLEWIQARPWFVTEAVKLDGEGYPARFPQGRQDNGFQPGARHPLIADPGRYVITIPLWRVERWTASELPDPYQVYRSS